jgi:Sulfotransferase family
VVPVNEPLIGWYLGVCTSDLGADPSSLDLDNFTLSRLRRSDRSNMFSNDFRDVWVPGLGRLLRARFYIHAVRSPSRVRFSRTLIAIKEPSGSQSADLIMAALPRARLLFLLRDGRDVVDSELAANLHGGWAIEEFPGARAVSPRDRLNFVTNSAYKWLWRTEVVQHAFADHNGPKYLVRYEDLLRDPHCELTSLFDWLGLDVADHELNEWIRSKSFDELPAESRGPDKFFRAGAPGLWRTNLTAGEIAVVDAIIGRKLQELGYHR